MCAFERNQGGQAHLLPGRRGYADSATERTRRDCRFRSLTRMNRGMGGRRGELRPTCRTLSGSLVPWFAGPMTQSPSVIKRYSPTLSRTHPRTHAKPRASKAGGRLAQRSVIKHGLSQLTPLPAPFQITIYSGAEGFVYSR